MRNLVMAALAGILLVTAASPAFACMFDKTAASSSTTTADNSQTPPPPPPPSQTGG